jgi:hypothetical protein
MKIDFHVLELMEVKMISWDIYMIEEFYFDVAIVKKY